MYIRKITAIYYISFYFAQYKMYSDQRKIQETNKGNNRAQQPDDGLFVPPKHVAGNFFNILMVCL